MKPRHITTVRDLLLFIADAETNGLNGDSKVFVNDMGAGGLVEPTIALYAMDKPAFITLEWIEEPPQ